MANVIGSGSPLFASWSAASAPTLPTNPPWSLEEEPRDALSLRTRELLTRVTSALEPHAGGLALTQLRAQIGAPASEIRTAVEAGLRARSIRRVGASSTLRYVLNPRD